MTDAPKLADLNFDDDHIDPSDCVHDGDTSRRFGGSIVCENCLLVIGNWRSAPTVTIPATRGADGSFSVAPGVIA